eukprot:Hpha_TRINITY_DN16480_c6_g5::TRINITY_DN16480_c6_g5_i1::g.163765::m.163765
MKGGVWWGGVNGKKHKGREHMGMWRLGVLVVGAAAQPTTSPTRPPEVQLTPPPFVPQQPTLSPVALPSPTLPPVLQPSIPPAAAVPQPSVPPAAAAPQPTLSPAVVVPQPSLPPAPPLDPRPTLSPVLQLPPSTSPTGPPSASPSSSPQPLIRVCLSAGFCLCPTPSYSPSVSPSKPTASPVTTLTPSVPDRCPVCSKCSSCTAETVFLVIFLLLWLATCGALAFLWRRYRQAQDEIEELRRRPSQPFSRKAPPPKDTAPVPYGPSKEMMDKEIDKLLQLEHEQSSELEREAEGLTWDTELQLPVVRPPSGFEGLGTW